MTNEFLLLFRSITIVYIYYNILVFYLCHYAYMYIDKKNDIFKRSSVLLVILMTFLR